VLLFCDDACDVVVVVIVVVHGVDAVVDDLFNALLLQ